MLVEKIFDLLELQETHPPAPLLQKERDLGLGVLQRRRKDETN
jgi:hypothetical protein